MRLRSRRRCGRRLGFTVLELLAVVGIVGLLLGLILPAIGSVREAARRAQCAGNLKQIGLALHEYHETFSTLPTGWQWEPSRGTAYGWAASLLPWLEQKTVFESIDRNRPLLEFHERQTRSATLDVYLCPSDLTSPTFWLYRETAAESDAAGSATAAVRGSPERLVELPTASYVGVFGPQEPDESIPAPPGDGAFVESRSVRFADFLRGLSNTFIVGERTMARVPSTWLGIDALGEDAACRLVGNAATRPNNPDGDECELDSRHPGCINVLWGDGRVQSISDEIDSYTYRLTSRRTDELCAAPVSVRR